MDMDSPDGRQILREVFTTSGGITVLGTIVGGMIFAYYSHSNYGAKPPVFEAEANVTAQSTPISRDRAYKEIGKQSDLYATYPYFFKADNYWGKAVWVNTPAATGIRSGQSVTVDSYRCSASDDCMIYQYLPNKHGPARDAR